METVEKRSHYTLRSAKPRDHPMALSNIQPSFKKEDAHTETMLAQEFPDQDQGHALPASIPRTYAELEYSSWTSIVPDTPKQSHQNVDLTALASETTVAPPTVSKRKRHNGNDDNATEANNATADEPQQGQKRPRLVLYTVTGRTPTENEKKRRREIYKHRNEQLARANELRRLRALYTNATGRSRKTTITQEDEDMYQSWEEGLPAWRQMLDDDETDDEEDEEDEDEEDDENGDEEDEDDEDENAEGEDDEDELPIV